MKDEAYIPSTTFDGVRFALFGFDALTENKVRSRLVNGGGVDVGGYTRNCTHVVVDKLVYDDPVCVAARDDGKILVTALWVDHSFDLGIVVDPTSIMYRPPKDLDGIPGAKNMIMCLTGYQRQDRDDIMTMVGLMGAQFSKPLVANKVTHLICYKFEGEKYELAKKMKRIKLVNHRWLEDCLREWDVLPEANYNRSGYDLEMLEAEAKDSEDEAERSALKQSGGQILSRSPYNTKVGNVHPSDVSNIPADSVVSKEKPKAVSTNPRQETGSNQILFDVNAPEKDSHHDIGTSGGATSEYLANQHNWTPISTKFGTDLASTSRTVRKSPSTDAKSCGLSYSRKNQRRTSDSVRSEGRLDDGHPSPVAHKDECHVDEYHQKSEQTNDASDIDSFLTPGRAGLLLSNTSKRKGNDAYDGFKYQKISPDVKFGIVGGSISSNKTQGSEAASLDCLDKTCSPTPLGKGDFDVNGTTNLHDARGSTTRQLISSKKVTPRDLPFGQTALLDIAQAERTNDNIHQTPSDILDKQTMDRNDDTGDTNMEKTGSVNDSTDVAINHPQNVEIVNSGERAENQKAHSPSEQDIAKETGAKSSGKSLKKKTVGKKTLGSRPKLNSTTNRKGPIYINKMASRNDVSMGLSEENRDANEIASPNNDGRSPSVDSFVKQAEIANDKKFGTCTAPQYESVNDGTEAPEERDRGWPENALDDGKALDNDESFNVESTCKTDTNNGLNFKGCEQDTKIAVCISTSKLGEADFNGEAGKVKTKAKPKVSKALPNDESRSDKSTCKTDTNDGLNFKGGEQDPKTPVCINTSKLGESEFKEEVGKGKTKAKPKAIAKVSKGKKSSSSDTDMKTTPSLVGIKNSGHVKDAKEVQSKIDDKDMAEEEERALHPRGKTNRSSKSVKRSKSSMDLGKENTPAVEGGKSMSNDSRNAEKNATDVSENTLKLAAEMEFPVHPKNEPACFIFSGHRLQRKEYLQVIKRLKGKVCRDSHQWSYQATHFVAPDPIRRTEKFFAATASGRWILKTDYLTACSQAGKLLAEEPYEWHENCLTEDGAINLEAPRKWRLIREKTGHGAFCGMRIIVYGDCIAPSLDTLKRVVKAGDGTILATSPPYTRFLNSGVDYAIVSPGMLRVDMWVQEFLKHEIPCVVADYLVEYVCKPGYPLERHVLYNTHAWAGKSFAKLQSRAEEIPKDMKPPENNESNDLDCEVCGSSDRGEVMLICGDESGSRGCGVGTHIDCCDPPLAKVPDEDWFCHKCTSSMGKKSKKRRKESS